MRFRLEDVYLPSGETIFAVEAGSVLEGRVIEFSDSGPKRQAFAVVEVVRTRLVVVPVEHLEKSDPAQTSCR